MLPITGNRGHSARPRSRKTLGDLGGRWRRGTGLLLTPAHNWRPGEVRGEMLPVLSGGRRLPLPGGLGALSLLTGIVQAWRGCLTAGIVRHGGARCLKTGKEQAPGPFPGARPDRSIVFFPVLSRRPVLAKCGGLAVRSSWRSGPAPRRGSRSRASTAGGLVEPRGVEAWQLGRSW